MVFCKKDVKKNNVIHLYIVIPFWCWYMLIHDFTPWIPWMFNPSPERSRSTTASEVTSAALMPNVAATKSASKTSLKWSMCVQKIWPNSAAWRPEWSVVGLMFWSSEEHPKFQLFQHGWFMVISWLFHAYVMFMSWYVMCISYIFWKERYEFLSPCSPIFGHPFWTRSGFLPLILAPLFRIQVHGLTNRPELNGKTGQIVTRWWFQRNVFCFSHSLMLTPPWSFFFKVKSAHAALSDEDPMWIHKLGSSIDFRFFIIDWQILKPAGGLWSTERPLFRAGPGGTWSWKRPNVSAGGELAGKKLHLEDWESQLPGQRNPEIQKWMKYGDMIVKVASDISSSCARGQFWRDRAKY